MGYSWKFENQASFTAPEASICWNMERPHLVEDWRISSACGATV